MEPHEALGPVGTACQARDRDRRGIGGQDGLGLQMRQQILENRCFHRFPFRRGFDHQVGGAHIGKCQGRLDPRECIGLRILGYLAAPHLTAEVAVDQRHGAVQRLLADIGHDDVIARQCADMCDAVAHLARTHNADRLDLHTGPFASRGSGTIGPAPERAQAVRAAPKRRAGPYPSFRKSAA
jgi:hypothetical protein